MLTLILVLTILGNLIQLYLMLVINNGFTITNKNVDQYLIKTEILLKNCDMIIGKYKNMLKEIDSIK